MDSQANLKYGFGAGNLMLVLAFGAFLSILVWAQHGSANFKGLSLFSLNSTKDSIAVAYDSNSNASSAAVLGADTVSQNFLDQFNSLKIVTSGDNTIGAVKNYVAQLQIVSKLDSNSAADKYIQDLATIAVPDTLSDYQRYYLVEQTLQIAVANPSHAHL